MTQERIKILENVPTIQHPVTGHTQTTLLSYIFKIHQDTFLTISMVGLMQLW